MVAHVAINQAELISKEEIRKMPRPKNFYDVVGITTDQQSGKKVQAYLGRFTSRKKADEEIRKAKIITVANKADAEFVVNIKINYMALGRSPPSTARLPVVRDDSGKLRFA
jgi:hypothetical protein